MPSFTLTIEMGNSAMLTTEDLSRAIEFVADAVLRDDEGKVRDENGNTVGEWKIND